MSKSIPHLNPCGLEGNDCCKEKTVIIEKIVKPDDKKEPEQQKDCCCCCSDEIKKRLCEANLNASEAKETANVAQMAAATAIATANNALDKAVTADVSQLQEDIDDVKQDILELQEGYSQTADSITTVDNKVKGIYNRYLYFSTAQVMNTSSNIVILHPKVKADGSDGGADTLTIPAATTTRAGVMTAADKQTLANNTSAINTLNSRVDNLNPTDNNFTNEYKAKLEQLDDFTSYVSDVTLGDVSSSNVKLNVETTTLGVTEPSVNEITLPNATTSTPGLLSASDKIKLNNLKTYTHIHHTKSNGESSDGSNTGIDTWTADGNNVMLNFFCTSPATGAVTEWGQEGESATAKKPIPVATATNAGVMTKEMFNKVNTTETSLSTLTTTVNTLNNKVNQIVRLTDLQIEDLNGSDSIIFKQRGSITPGIYTVSNAGELESDTDPTTFAGTLYYWQKVSGNKAKHFLTLITRNVASAEFGMFDNNSTRIYSTISNGDNQFTSWKPISIPVVSIEELNSNTSDFGIANVMDGDSIVGTLLTTRYIDRGDALYISQQLQTYYEFDGSDFLEPDGFYKIKTYTREYIESEWTDWEIQLSKYNIHEYTIIPATIPSNDSSTVIFKPLNYTELYNTVRDTYIPLTGILNDGTIVRTMQVNGNWVLELQNDSRLRFAITDFNWPNLTQIECTVGTSENPVDLTQYTTSNVIKTQIQNEQSAALVSDLFTGSLKCTHNNDTPLILSILVKKGFPSLTLAAFTDMLKNALDGNGDNVDLHAETTDAQDNFVIYYRLLNGDDIVQIQRLGQLTPITVTSMTIDRGDYFDLLNLYTS